VFESGWTPVGGATPKDALPTLGAWVNQEDSALFAPDVVDMVSLCTSILNHAANNYDQGGGNYVM
jgi:hypothetical protein